MDHSNILAVVLAGSSESHKDLERQISGKIKKGKNVN